MQRIGKILWVLMWTVLWASGLVGLFATGFVIYLMAEHAWYCQHPRSQGVAAECLTTEDAAAFLIVRGVPWLLPLSVALVVRALLRRASS